MDKGNVDHRDHVKKALEEAIPFVDRLGYGGIAHIMYDAISLLKEQEVVLCEDCKHWEKHEFYNTCDKNIGHGYPPNWFCADGKRKDGEQNG